MKKYTHAWLAFKAIERLETTHLARTNKKYAIHLVSWFKNHKDGVIQGAWYPDAVIKDMAYSHVLKFTPEEGKREFRNLPSSSLMYARKKTSALFKKGFSIDKNTNLPSRCEAIAHAVIDNLKMQETEAKGSPISPTDNHVATLLFMLSHYIADAHVPFHCDSRKFSQGDNLHGHIEGLWEKEIEKLYSIDKANERFFYQPNGYPLPRNENQYPSSLLALVETELSNRKFLITWGRNNSSTLDFMTAVCQYSYLLSYDLFPSQYNETSVTLANWQNLPGQGVSFEQFSVIVLADAIDSTARVWLRVWRRYMKWNQKG